MKPPRSTLGNLERAVMDILWDHPGADAGMTVREVHTLLPDRKLAYTTVMTVLTRLAKKGIVSRVRDGRAWRYTALSSRQSLTARAMRDPLDDLSRQDQHSAILHFIHEASPDEIASLRAAMAEVEERIRRTAG